MGVNVLWLRSRGAQDSAGMKAAFTKVDEQPHRAVADNKVADYLRQVAVICLGKRFNLDNDLIFNYEVGNIIAEQLA